MSDNTSGDRAITLGDPAPWFTAPLIGDGTFSLQVAAGRWVVLSFLGSPDDPKAKEELAKLLHDARLFHEDRIVFYGVFTTPPSDPSYYVALNTFAISFIADYDGAISRAFGATDAPRTVVLDPMLRAIADIPWDFAEGHAKTVRNVVTGLPSVDDSAGVPLTAPVLIVPRVLGFDLCDFLIQFYDKLGGSESGFLLDQDGQTSTVVDHRLKRRNDLNIVHPQVRDAIRGQIAHRLVPAIDCFFQFQATRMDRYIVACYDSATGGHFYRHRDNVNAGARHRRFAVTINLNGDYDGGDLAFPEFGSRAYRAPHGGAIVFSCGALHQVTPMTRGTRYAFLAFLYGEADARLRHLNNAKIAQSEYRYSGGDSDRLFPGLAANEDMQEAEREPTRRTG
ncbi:MAG TPA: 2OG-Fe(II) oxygenase [Xanthobacteraceae bacterium]|jgi:predicted 2-oxoglutarate/Fe(II)-dependent dioxygenase YbiX/peroxiredoxin|nr:2OG-Fe(II) oxygenase [Xanthobacteraceae bacterium]